MLGETAVRGLIDCILKYALKWTSAGRKDMISLPRNRAMCNHLQVITSLPVCAKRAVTYVRHWNNLFGVASVAWRYVRHALYARRSRRTGYYRYLKYAPKWTSAGRTDMISLPRNRAMCNRLQVRKFLTDCFWILTTAYWPGVDSDWCHYKVECWFYR